MVCGLKIQVLWGVKPCRLSYNFRSFEELYSLHLQDQRDVSSFLNPQQCSCDNFQLRTDLDCPNLQSASLLHITFKNTFFPSLISCLLLRGIHRINNSYFLKYQTPRVSIPCLLLGTNHIFMHYLYES